MKTMIIERVPDEVKRDFKSHCAKVEISMREALIRLMGLVIEGRILACPIDKEIEKEVERGA